MNFTHAPDRQALDVGDEAVLHRLQKGVAGLVSERLALQLDHRLLDVGVGAAEHDRGALSERRQNRWFCCAGAGSTRALLRRDGGAI